MSTKKNKTILPETPAKSETNAEETQPIKPEIEQPVKPEIKKKRIKVSVTKPVNEAEGVEKKVVKKTIITEVPSRRTEIKAETKTIKLANPKKEKNVVAKNIEQGNTANIKPKRKQPVAKTLSIEQETSQLQPAKNEVIVQSKPVHHSTQSIQTATPEVTRTLQNEQLLNSSKSDSEKSEKLQQPEVINVTFQLKFSSEFGQSIYIVGNHELLGSNEPATAVAMQYLNQDFWFVTIGFPSNIAENISYNYIVKNADGSTSMEWGNDKTINPSAFKTISVLIIDSWNYAGYYENTFYTEPFKQVLLKENFTAFTADKPATFTHTFKVKAPLLPKNHTLCISGNATGLNAWNIEKVLPLSRTESDWLTIDVDLTNDTFPVTYKYGVYNIEEKKLVAFESGNNRMATDAPSPGKQIILADGYVKLPNNTFKGAGVSIPVFSLRSNDGMGVGEFSDLKKLVDWAKIVGLKVIQILPVNDTTATHTSADSYPYAAISAFALHPVYLHVPAVIGDSNPTALAKVQSKSSDLNAAVDVDYEMVMNAKLEIVKEIYPLLKEQTFSSEEFNSFFASNAHWLVPYAAFCFLRDQNNTADFTKWSLHNTFDVFEINALATPVLTTNDAISIHYFIQFHLHLQLKAATEYAHANGVIVKGDIPIGIFRNSCDAWQQPQLYNMHMQAGAPPDDFAIKGQNWGFPTYNWQRMAEDGFSWWKQRFAQMSYYFDAFRIDHILGFFRIWSIPTHAVEGIMGYFVPAIPIHISEFNEKGIWFDQYRYIKSFINDAVLDEIFGNDAEEVKATYLNKKHFENYELLADFNTQKKVDEYFASLEINDENNKLKQGLFDLLSNIILFEVEGSEGQEYHFRIAVENTSSFRHLDNRTKQQLKELYVNYFYRRQDDFWMKEAMNKLPELKRSTNMLICGEDLGMVPDCVAGVMKQLGILSLEIQRMPKDPSREFFHPNDAPYLSVVTPSTHDMSTIRGWWQEDRAKTQRFFNHQLTQHGNAPYFCEAWINRAIVLQHLYSPAMWCIFQLQDILGTSATLRRENPEEERINIPANPKHYWRYRMHLTIEDLINQAAFNNEFAGQVKSSGR